MTEKIVKRNYWLIIGSGVGIISSVLAIVGFITGIWELSDLLAIARNQPEETDQSSGSPGERTGDVLHQPRVLLVDDFEDRDISDWLYHETGWLILADDDRPDNRVLEGVGRGSKGIFYGSEGWDNYQVKFRFRIVAPVSQSAADRDLMAALLRQGGYAQMGCDGYKWILGADTRLVRQNGCGAEEPLTRSDYVPPLDTWVFLRIQVFDGNITVYADGDLVFEYEEINPIESGRVGFSVYEPSIVWFDDVEVVELLEMQ